MNFQEFEISYGTKFPSTLQGQNISKYYTSTDIPSIYKQTVIQPKMGFAYLPKSVEHKKCVTVKSESIFLIKTARNAAFERFSIRRQFKDSKNYYFILGTDQNGFAFDHKSGLGLEVNLYDDIVVADFIDTYNNLPLKTRSMYEFAKNHWF